MAALIHYPNSHAKILGGALYRNGAVIGSLGQEPPMLLPSGMTGDRTETRTPVQRRTQRYSTPNGARYDAEAAALARKFQDNFKRFTKASETVVAAGPIIV